MTVNVQPLSSYGQLLNDKLNVAKADIFKFGLSANKQFNKTIGRACFEINKITHSDDKESPLSFVRTVDGIFAGLSDVPACRAALETLLPENIVRVIPGAHFALSAKMIIISKQVSNLKTVLTFTEIIGRVKKWRETDVQHTSWARIANKLFNIGQKSMETFILIPAKWGLYDLGNFCIRVGSLTGRAITPLHFNTLKDLCMIASSSFAVYASIKEIAAWEAELGTANEARKKELAKNIKATTIGRNFDFFKATLGVCIVTTNVVAVSTMGPAGLAAVKVAGFAAGWAVSGIGIQRTLFSTWEFPKAKVA